MTIHLKDLFEVSEQMNDKVLTKLLIAIKESQQKDFDYLKFKQSYKSLIDLGMDEATAAKSAFLTASTMGLTKDKLLQTVQYYKNVLHKEKEQFALALKNQVANNVDAKTIEIKRLHDKMEEHHRKILQMQKEQDVMTAQIKNLEEAAILSRQKIEETRDQFKATYDQLLTEIEVDGRLYDQIL